MEKEGARGGNHVGVSGKRRSEGTKFLVPGESGKGSQLKQSAGREFCELVNSSDRKTEATTIEGSWRRAGIRLMGWKNYQNHHS